MKKNRGLSTVVTTLIIVLLVLVAVGIIWGVVNNLLQKGSSTIETSTECLAVEMNVISVTNSSLTIDTSPEYIITVSREPIGEGSFGAKMVFFNDTGASVVVDLGYMLAPFETKTITTTTVSTIAVNKVDVTPYFIDDQGVEKICSNVITYEF